MSTRVTKVLAYITWAGRLLVFRQRDIPDAGLQVPAGTVEAGEAPAQAVLREIHEETGLTDLPAPRLLGVTEFDLSPVRAEVQERHVFHVGLRAEPPAEWHHVERHRSDGGPPVVFEFFWLALNDAALGDLAGGQGALLHLLAAGDASSETP